MVEILGMHHCYLFIRKIQIVTTAYVYVLVNCNVDGTG